MSLKLLSQTQLSDGNFQHNNTSFSGFELSGQLQNQKQVKGTEIDYISQFLQLPALQSSIQSINKTNSLSIHQNSIQNKKQQQMTHQSTQNIGENKINKSIFHNFQKQLVITLKLNIKFDKFNLKKCLVASLARKIWTLFLYSKYYSKKILTYVFGVLNSLKEKNAQQKRNDALLSFFELYKNNTEEDIAQAQRYLREEVIRQGKKLKAKDIFSKRKMQKTEEFEYYFFNFIQELQLGPMTKRMSKLSKLEVIKQITKMKDQDNL